MIASEINRKQLTKQVMFIVIVVFLENFCFAQQLKDYSIDSLVKTNFKPWHLEEFKEVERVSRIYIKYGEQNRDSLILADGLHGLTFSKETDTVVRYLNKLIDITREWKNEFYYTLPHLVLGSLYYDLEEAELALKAFNAGYERSKETNHSIRIVDYLNAIAGVKGTYGKLEEALDIHHRALYLTIKKKTTFGAGFERQMMYNYNNIAVQHLEQRVVDSVFYYVELTRNTIDLESYPDFINEFDIIEAQANYYAGNYLECKTVLDSIVNNYENLEKADILYFVAKSEEAFGNIKKRDSLLAEIDTIMGLNPYPVDNTPEVYNILLRNAIKKEGMDKQLDYLEKLIYFDSLISLNQVKVRAIPVDPKFTVKNLKQMRSDLMEKLDKRSLFLNYTIVAASLLLFGFGYYIFKYKRAEKLLKETLRLDIRTVSSKTATVEANLEPVMNKLLVQLDEWEQNLGFLDRTITQKTLAKLLDTNDTYLSKLVNEYKELSFSNYVKDLRITYCINDLKNNPEKLGNKSSILVAETYGFNSLDVFSRTLKSKIGATPGQFFRQIRRGNL